MKFQVVILSILVLVAIGGSYHQSNRHEAQLQDHTVLLSLMKSQLQSMAGELNTLRPWTQVMANARTERAIEHPYQAIQATGPPDTGSTMTDHPLSWCPAEQDSGQPWLLLHYPQAIDVSRIKIYANYNPGAVDQIVSIDSSGSETILWHGTAALAEPLQVIDLQEPIHTQAIRLRLDPAKVPGWNEIDAVQILADNGSSAWASHATASCAWSRDQPGAL